MTDRELLEKAAKAAGLIAKKNTEVVDADDRFIGIKVRNTEREKYRLWNPLTDDGDALRLAVALPITVHLDGSNPRYVRVDIFRPGSIYTPIYEYSDDKATATRRTIVRAAAALAGD